MSRRIALVLRGHIRDAFDNERLRQFLFHIANDHRLCVHLYVQTWTHLEAQRHCSWRPLEDVSLNTDVTVETLRAYIPIPAYGLRIMRDEDAMLVGGSDGFVGGTSKLGWKRMWYGIYTIVNDIRNGAFVYDNVLSLRFDFFGDYVTGRHVEDYGRVISGEDLVEWAATTNPTTISFLTDSACTGVDNCYMGPITRMFTLCACFHFNLDHTCSDVGVEYNHEKMVYKMARRLCAESTSENETS